MVAILLLLLLLLFKMLFGKRGGRTIRTTTSDVKGKGNREENNWISCLDDSIIVEIRCSCMNIINIET
jgi:hypothetical protein